MPHAIASSDGVVPVEHYDRVVRELLTTAHGIKPEGRIEPALKASDFGGGVKIQETLGDNGSTHSKEARSAAIETALRRIFYEVLATTSIEQPEFVKLWSLLDITTILSDIDCCEYNLPFWLVEELLESQTLDGCRTIFNYLESRRVSMVAKHYQRKYLTILRACNDLLKRLSRAEDTVFCGRVFIYLFSSLTFGDRSSVNLRGEFHLANVTSFDQTPTSKTEDGTSMEVDQTQGQTTAGSTSQATITLTELAAESNAKSGSSITKKVKVDGDDAKGEHSMDSDTLYPVFWSLQEYFSKPTTLFEAESLTTFKSGLEATVTKFKQVQKDTDHVAASNDEKPTSKRKWQGDDHSSKAAFNPKYLTSRDLFELEISDLSFRRHVLVQSLIILDFLLAQTPKAKAKLESSKNKAVIWPFTLDEGSATWAEKMKHEIANYLSQGQEGKFYFRMVDNVLSRDKNWVHWKAENCPSFTHVPVSPSLYVDARTGARRATTTRRPKNNPLGALDVSFLLDAQAKNGLEKLQDPARSSVPAMDAYRLQIEDDDFDINGAKGDEKERVVEARASKTWRTLRIASRSRFGVFSKLDDGSKLDVLFADPEEENATQDQAAAEPSETREEREDSGNDGHTINDTDITVDMQDENTQAASEHKSHGPDQAENEAGSERPEGVVSSGQEDVMSDVVPSAGDTRLADGETADPIDEPAIT